MALNPVVAFGLAMGAAASIIVYLRHKDIKEAVMAFVKVFLATGTPLHFIMVGIYLGSQVNRLIYRRWSHNWSAFIVSLLGILPLIGVWQFVMRALIGLAASGVDDLGGALVVGIGLAYILVILMLAGSGFYVVSSFYTSFKRRDPLELLEVDGNPRL